MRIADLISKVDYHFNDVKGQAVTDPEIVRSLLQKEVSGIYNDSRKVEKGGLFFCIAAQQLWSWSRIWTSVTMYRERLRSSSGSMIPAMPWPGSQPPIMEILLPA